MLWLGWGGCDVCVSLGGYGVYGYHTLCVILVACCLWCNAGVPLGGYGVSGLPGLLVWVGTVHKVLQFEHSCILYLSLIHI